MPHNWLLNALFISMSVGVGVFASVQPELLVAAVGVLALGVVGWRWTGLPIALLVLGLVIHQTYIGAIRFPLANMRWILMILPLLIFLAKQRWHVASVRKVYIFDILSIFWILLVFLSITYSVDPLLTAMRGLSVILLYILVFWFCWDLASASDVDTMLLYLLLPTGIVFAIGLVLALTSVEESFSAGRFRGILENPNTVGLVAALMMPIAVERLLRRREKWMYGLAAILVVSLALSGSRGGTIGVLLGSGWVLWKAYGGRTWLVGMYLAAVGFLAFRLDSLATMVSSAMVMRFDDSGRFESWTAATGLLRPELLLRGQGFGTEGLLFEMNGIIFINFQGSYMHNAYIGLLVQMGLLGAGLFFGPLIWLLTQEIKESWGTVGLGPRVALQGVLLAGLFTATIESWIYAVGNGEVFPFWLCVMLLLRERVKAPRKVILGTEREAWLGAGGLGR